METAEHRQVNSIMALKGIIHNSPEIFINIANISAIMHDESEYDSLQLQPEEDDLGISDEL